MYKYITIIAIFSGKVVKILVFSTTGDRNSAHLQIPLKVKYCTKSGMSVIASLLFPATSTVAQGEGGGNR
jgi:hypothetical protein